MRVANKARRRLLRHSIMAFASLPLLAKSRAFAQNAPAATPQELPPLDAQQVPAAFNRRARVVGTVAKLLEGSGDTILYVMLDDFEKPIYIKCSKALGRPERHRKYEVTGTVLRDVSDARITGGFYVLADAQTLEGTKPPNPPGNTPGDVPPKDDKTTREKDEGLPEWAIPAGAGVVVVGGFLGFAYLKSKKPLDTKEAGKRNLAEVVGSVTGLAGSTDGLTVAEPGISRTPSANLPREGAVLDPPVSAARIVTQMQWGTLLVKETGCTIPLLDDRITLGRNHRDIPLPGDDSSVSGTHGFLVREAGTVFFNDDSKNGTVVNGERIHRKRVPVVDGATIQIGKTSLSLGLIPGLPPPGPPAAIAPPEAPATKPARAATQMVEPEPPSDAGRPRAATEMIEPVVATKTAKASSGTAEFHRAQLEVIDGPDRDKRAPIFGEVVTIGRFSDQVLRLEHPTVSRAHATVSCRDGRYYLLNVSDHGTVLNGHPVAGEVEIRSEDEFQIGANRVRLVAIG